MPDKPDERELTCGELADSAESEEFHDSGENNINDDGFPVEAEPIGEPGRNFFTVEPEYVFTSSEDPDYPNSMIIAGLDRRIWERKRSEWERQFKVTIDLSAPLELARILVMIDYVYDGFRTLHYTNGDWLQWDPYSEFSLFKVVSQRELETQAYVFLDDTIDRRGLPTKPTKSAVKQIMHALKVVCALPESVKTPAYGGIENRQDFEARFPAGELRQFGQQWILPRRNEEGVIPRLWVSPGIINTNAVAYEFDETLGPPEEFQKFLDSILPDDSEAQQLLQEFIGLALFGGTEFHKILLIIGPPRSGKGTIGHVLTALLGVQNVTTPNLSDMSSDFGLASFIGKRLAIFPDVRMGGGGRGAAAAVERLLTVSGGDTININRKYKEYWTGKLETRIVFLTNELPRLTDSSSALVNRFVIVNIKESFLGREDLGLLDRLLIELPQIAVWAFEGYEDLKQRGHFTKPASSLALFNEFTELTSPITGFVRECCEVGADYSVDRQELYDIFVGWGRRNGHVYSKSSAVFGRDLRAALPQVGRSQPRSNGVRQNHYSGIKLAQANTNTPCASLVPSVVGDNAVSAEDKGA